jgi:hypothetical protein
VSGWGKPDDKICCKVAGDGEELDEDDVEDSVVASRDEDEDVDEVDDEDGNEQSEAECSRMNFSNGVSRSSSFTITCESRSVKLL